MFTCTRIVREVVFAIRARQTLSAQLYINTNNKAAAAAGVSPIEIAQSERHAPPVSTKVSKTLR